MPEPKDEILIHGQCSHTVSINYSVSIHLDHPYNFIYSSGFVVVMLFEKCKWYTALVCSVILIEIRKYILGFFLSFDIIVTTVMFRELDNNYIQRNML